MGVTATASALEAIARLQAARGPVAFFQSGGCCDGSSPMCFPEGELLLGPNDLLLGEVGGSPYYIDAEQYERWRDYTPALTPPWPAGSMLMLNTSGLSSVFMARSFFRTLSGSSRSPIVLP